MTEQDTIIIKAPAGTKARWVRQSQREGKKLSDWVVERVKMQVFKVPGSLADKYHGAGLALAAIVQGQLVGLVYITDVLPDFSGNAQEAINDPLLGPTVRQLQALGQVSVGMCSAWEFCQL